MQSSIDNDIAFGIVGALVGGFLFDPFGHQVLQA
jgi:uncharacterized membrane protein YeaQ/YmgE (transglycosylase-associated protein family)